jgi:glycosyltransferase involved in cell wall biosynthesis
VPEKGLHELLEAFEGVRTDRRLVVAGELSAARYEDSVLEMAAKDPRVLVAGFASDAVLDELYTNCLLYVLPSHVEGMPMSLLEAMSHGCLCLTSDIPENRDVLNGAGLMFEKGSVESLRAALEGARPAPTGR